MTGPNKKKYTDIYNIRNRAKVDLELANEYSERDKKKRKDND